MASGERGIHFMALGNRMAFLGCSRTYCLLSIPHTNVTQHNSTNDAVLKVVLLRRKVHEFLTLLNGTQDYDPHFMKHMLTGCPRKTP